jgi:hypothetical protein
VVVADLEAKLAEDKLAEEKAESTAEIVAG